MSHQRITAGPGDNDIDEIVADFDEIHIERMDNGLFWMHLTRHNTPTGLHVWFTAERRGDLRLSAHWNGDPWPDITHTITKWFPTGEDT